jgi:hypothetical protein
MLDDPRDVFTEPVAEALATSPVPRETKIQLFTMAGKHKNWDHRRVAFEALKNVDRERSVELLNATLDALPETPAGSYGDCSEKAFVPVVCAVEDERAWQALERAARRADPALRMELLGNVEYPRPKAVQLGRRLAFLARFLDDDELRDARANPDMYRGRHAGFGFEQLEVRNFAALKIAELLELRVEMTPQASATQWAKFRERMRDAVK